MPSFEFCYINEDGSLACTLAACFADETHAKTFARAMKLSDRKDYEVWQGERLVYKALEQTPEPMPGPQDKAAMCGRLPGALRHRVTSVRAGRR